MTPITRPTCLAAIVLLCGITAQAKDVIRFQDGTMPPEALQHVAIKTMVAEFSGPPEGGLGRSVGALVYAETWNAMSDQRGAGLLYLIHEKDESVGLIDRLDRLDGSSNYHVLVEEIAARQKARAVLWGIVSQRGDDLVIRTYLTILAREEGRHLSVRVMEESGAATNPTRRLEPQEGVEVSLLPSRINFAPIVVSRATLFAQRLVTKQAVVLRDAASPEGQAVAELAQGTRLEAVDMDGLYFEVALENGGKAFVHHERVDVEPRMHAGTSRTRYSLPAVHFLAGLYRYYGGRYAEAADQFELFVDTAGGAGYGYNRAIARQMAGASYLMSGNPPRALQALEAAQELTPYDPAVYRLLAVALLGQGFDAKEAVAFVEQALRLDRRDPETVMLLRSFVALSRADPGGYLSRQLRDVRESIAELDEEYRRGQ